MVVKKYKEIPDIPLAQRRLVSGKGTLSDQWNEQKETKWHVMFLPESRRGSLHGKLHGPLTNQSCK
jgi:hypothetical protein